MRTRLARLLLAAARRLDRDVVPSDGSVLGPPRTVEVAWRDPVPRSELNLAECAQIDSYLASLGATAPGGSGPEGLAEIRDALNAALAKRERFLRY